MDQTLLLLRGSQIPAQGITIPYAAQHSFKKKKKKDVCYNEKPAKELSSFLVFIVHLFI